MASRTEKAVNAGRPEPMNRRSSFDLSSLSLHLSLSLSNFLSVYLLNLSIPRSIHLSVYVSIQLSIYLSIYLSLSHSLPSPASKVGSLGTCKTFQAFPCALVTTFSVLCFGSLRPPLRCGVDHYEDGGSTHAPDVPCTHGRLKTWKHNDGASQQAAALPHSEI